MFANFYVVPQITVSTLQIVLNGFGNVEIFACGGQIWSDLQEIKGGVFSRGTLLIFQTEMTIAALVAGFAGVTAGGRGGVTKSRGNPSGVSPEEAGLTPDEDTMI